MNKTNRKFSRGFTLLEILLVIALIAILAVILIITVNPARRFAEARNAQRKVDISAIASAAYQYAVDHNGDLPATIPEDTNDTCTNWSDEICKNGITCSYIDLAVLTEDQRYLAAMPQDPSGQYTQGDGNGYLIEKSANSRITICAPHAELGESITLTR